VAKTVQAQGPELNERARAALPIRMFHAPKCGGTSMFNAIFAVPGVCDGDEPPVYSGGDGGCSSAAKCNELPRILESCPGFAYGHPAHPCLAPLLPEASGHIFGMFRQPEQRLISLHNYAQLESSRQPGSPFAFPPHGPPEDVREFLEGARGGMVFQLTHPDPDEWFCTGHTPEYPPVTDTQVQEAIRMINEDFAFVGITEQWDLSICLMHVMFGGECTPGEFEDNNPGLDPVTRQPIVRDEYDVTPLQGAVDEPDDRLYEEALRIFERNLEEFGVTHEMCEEGCWAAVRRES